MKSILAKVGGWLQFAATATGQLGNTATPHGWAQWLLTLASLAGAVGIHAASNTDGSN